MRHEAEIKSNAYWLGLLAHLQASSVPRKVKGISLELNFLSLSLVLIFLLDTNISCNLKCKNPLYFHNGKCYINSSFYSGVQDISCIKDLTLLYEAATIEDICLAYEQLKVDEDSLYSCIGVAGTQAGEEIAG